MYTFMPIQKVVETDMPPGVEEPTYHIKLDLNGRTYVAKRQHAKLRALIDCLRTRGYSIWQKFPDVEDMLRQAPVKALPDTMSAGNDGCLVESLPFYEGFGYSIKALASTVLRSSAAGLRKRRSSLQLEQVSQKIDGFLKQLFSDNEDLQYEQEVYQFFWEPLQKKLPPVVEEEDGTSDREQEEEEEDGNDSLKSLPAFPCQQSQHQRKYQPQQYKQLSQSPFLKK